MKRCTLIALSCALSYAADSDFNGRWLIQGKDGGPPRANWMEINGAGTPSASGWYVSAYAGDRNPIKDLAVKDGELRFSFERVNRDKTRKDLIVYRARLAGGKLEGSTEVEGSGRKTEWIAWRAPEISDRDDGSWVAGEIVPLFDGKSMEHWQPNEGWGIVEGVLRNQGKVRDLVTKDSFWNFRLQVDYRVMQRSNSGIGLRGRYEIQIIDDFGREPNTHTNGALYSRVPPPFNASKPAGEWQTYDIRLVGRQLTIDLNGKRIHDKVEIEGLTAIASNPFEDQPGPIVLQGDHGPVEFRRILLTNLVKK